MKAGMSPTGTTMFARDQNMSRNVYAHIMKGSGCVMVCLATIAMGVEGHVGILVG